MSDPRAIGSVEVATAPGLKAFGGTLHAHSATRSNSSPASLSFWHPVGPHGLESLEEIVRRKREDIVKHGFTYWSFAAARAERVVAWRQELVSRGLFTCTAVCCGDSAVDPSKTSRQVRWATEYSDDLINWHSVPSRMTSFHSPRGEIASAFVVRALSVVQTRVERPARWFRAADRSWEQSRVPTRGQYLVEQPPESERGQKVRLLLTIDQPFVVWVR